jgi:NTP pyrophosphatase (non-canonical NTP hydrolase)
MTDFKELQKRIYQNKVNKGFNTEDVYKEICACMKELGEVVEAYWNKEDKLGEEIADVAIFLLGLSEILGIDLEQEILKKVDKNEKRIYKKNKDGVLMRERTPEDP